MKKTLKNAKIMFLGSGYMAGALIRGMIEKELAPPAHIFVKGGAHPEKVSALAEQYEIQIAQEEDIRDADLVVLAFKPQNFKDAMRVYAPYFSPETTVFSILAGIPCTSIEQAISGCPVVRLMPNLALSVGLSATGYCLGRYASESDAAAAQELFGALGAAAQVEEAEMSAVTAVSGSGPAYFYYLAEAMIDAAVKDGMAEDAAKELAVQTMIGAARLIADSGDEPAQMRAKITSKGGTTEAAIRAMTETGFPLAVERGYAACKARSDELAAQFS